MQVAQSARVAPKGMENVTRSANPGMVVPPVSVALTVTVAGTPGRLNPEAVAASFVSATVIVVAAVIVGLAESVTLTV